MSDAVTGCVNKWVRDRMREDAIRQQIMNRFSPIPLLPEDLLHLFTPESLAAVAAINQKRKIQMNRADIYSAIDGERDYQLSRWGVTGLNRGGDGGPGGEPFHEVAAWITYMQRYMTKAVEMTSTSANDADALDVIRKVVALGVACLEQHGCPRREGY